MNWPSVGGVAKQAIDRVLRESQALVLTKRSSRVDWRSSAPTIRGLERTLPSFYEPEASRGLPEVFILAEVNVGPAGMLTCRPCFLIGWEVIRVRFEPMVTATQRGEVARAGRTSVAIGLPRLRMVDVAAPRGSRSEERRVGKECRAVWAARHGAETNGRDG